jgi:DNA polymerase III subunit delta
LAELAAQPPPDVVCLVVTDKLDKKASDAAWVRAVEKHGVWVPIWPVETAALPAWLRARARMLKVEIEPAAAQLIVERVEGNLLAAKQELDKLSLLADGAPISADLVLRSVGDSARYDVFQLAEAAAAGDGARALRVLLGLKSEGVEPSLILWALVRELRGLWQARERDRLRSTMRGSGWNLAATPSPRALSRLKKLPLARLLKQASHTDRVIKGLAMGDAWSALTGLTGGLAGALQAPAESGRVAV